MKKRLFLCVIAVCTMLAVAACGSDSGKNQGDYDTKIDDAQLAAYLIDNVTFRDTLDVIDDDLAMELYDLDADTFENMTVYAGTGATAEEVAVIAVKDDTQAAEVKEEILDRIEDQKKGFENYVPGELTKLADPVITQIGNCVVLVVCDDSSEAENALNNYDM